jgi:hypothetical protein
MSWGCSRDSCTRFSTLGFFHQSTAPRTLIHELTPFGLIFDEKIDNIRIDPAEAGSLTPLKRFQRGPWRATGFKTTIKQ